VVCGDGDELFYVVTNVCVKFDYDGLRIDLALGVFDNAVSTFTPRSSHILISMFTHSPLLASRLAAGRRSASWAR